VRPRVNPDYTATVGLSREQGRALIAAADADPGRARLRSAAVIRLLLHNALRVDEVLGADVADLGVDRGHQVLTVLGKGNRRAKVPLTPATVAALHAYLDHRTTPAGVESRSGAWRGITGPLLATTTGRRIGPVCEQVRGGDRPPPTCSRPALLLLLRQPASLFSKPQRDDPAGVLLLRDGDLAAKPRGEPRCA
jgi:integrase